MMMGLYDSCIHVRQVCCVILPYWPCMLYIMYCHRSQMLAIAANPPTDKLPFNAMLNNPQTQSVNQLPSPSQICLFYCRLESLTGAIGIVSSSPSVLRRNCASQSVP